MGRRAIRCSPFTLSLAALMIVARAAAAATAEPEPLAARVDRVFARWDTTRSPGCALGVSQDGRIKTRSTSARRKRRFPT
jgi:CubicO group peptidase (beta-lactamase class C family)